MAAHIGRFMEQAREQFPDAPEDEITRHAEQLRRQYFQRLAYMSAQARRKRKIRQLIAQNERSARELARLGDDAA
jgi:hypothetical protein